MIIIKIFVIDEIVLRLLFLRVNNNGIFFKKVMKKLLKVLNK